MKIPRRFVLVCGETIYAAGARVTEEEFRNGILLADGDSYRFLSGLTLFNIKGWPIGIQGCKEADPCGEKFLDTLEGEEAAQP